MVDNHVSRVLYYHRGKTIVLESHPPLPRVPNSQGSTIYSPMDTYFGVEIVGGHTFSQCHLLGRNEKNIAMIKAPHALLIHIVSFITWHHKIQDFVKFSLKLTTAHVSYGIGYFFLSIKGTYCACRIFSQYRILYMLFLYQRELVQGWR